MIPLNTDDILSHLQSRKIIAQVEPETHQIAIMLKIGEREFPLFIRIYQGGELLQFLAFIPCHINEKTSTDTARLLHMLNKQIDLPGFSMDEESRTVFYRFMLPVHKQEIDIAIFDALVNAVQVVCTSFAPVIVTVAAGAATFEEVVKRAQEQAKQAQNKKE